MIEICLSALATLGSSLTTICPASRSGFRTRFADWPQAADFLHANGSITVARPFNVREMRELVKRIPERKELSGGKLRLFTFEVNEGAQAFYEKNGFRFVGKHTFLLGSDPQTDLLMQREF